MYYFIDESGNWQEIQEETNKLVIAGMVCKDKKSFDELDEDIKFFKIRHKLENVHAADIKDRLVLDELYMIIEKHIKKDSFQVLAYVINPKKFYSTTQIESDEVYIDTSANLIKELAFGDEDIKVEYDMKFHYAYPQNVLQNLKITKEWNQYSQMARNFEITKKALKLNQDRIKKLILKNRYRIPNYEYFISKIDDTENKNFITKYLWTEFRLKVEKASIIRERFKERINSLLKQDYLDFGIDVKYKLDIIYSQKQEQSAGVEVIDVINNLIWRNRKIDLLNYIEIKDL